MSIEDDELERYAAILGRVSVGTPLAEVLSELGLDEASFDALEARIERELSVALAAPGDSPRHSSFATNAPSARAKRARPRHRAWPRCPSSVSPRPSLR
jgi:hypothetical protein